MLYTASTLPGLFFVSQLYDPGFESCETQQRDS